MSRVKLIVDAQDELGGIFHPLARDMLGKVYLCTHNTDMDVFTRDMHEINIFPTWLFSSGYTIDLLK